MKVMKGRNEIIEGIMLMCWRFPSFEMTTFEYSLRQRMIRERRTENREPRTEKEKREKRKEKRDKGRKTFTYASMKDLRTN